MKFIEIKEGVCVRKDDITAIESVTSMTCKVIIDNNLTYESHFSYRAIRQLLEMDGIEEKINNNAVLPASTTGQYFAG